YQSYDENRGLFTKLLSVELVSRTFLFIGFSFNDPNLDRILSIAKSSLNSRTLPRHYCFMRKVQITDYVGDQEKQSDDAFEKFIRDKNYQELRIKDMANYGIYTILIDDFKQITWMLKF
ncbi:MAG: SIR2 family protein, partial [Bacteroides sp.]|nr:SIR2 family protein [Bacteroides sp.]